VPKILWEIWNEPVNASWATIRSYANDLLPVIRAYSPDIVIVGSGSWSRRPQYALTAPIQGDSAIAYSTHFYACSDTTALQNTVTLAAAKVPVFLSEWGTTSSDGRTGYCTNWSDSWLALAKTLGLSWTNWSFSDIGGNSQALTGTSFTSLTTSGTYVKGKIQEAYANLQQTLAVNGRSAAAPRRDALAARYAGTALSIDLPAGTRSFAVRDLSGRTLARREASEGSVVVPLDARGLVLVQAIGDRGASSVGVVIAP
jgi:endoglucanase